VLEGASTIAAGGGAVDFADGHNSSRVLESLRTRWQARRDEFARFDATVHGARLCDELLADLDDALRRAADDLLSIRDAAALSGYSPDHLGRLLRNGTIRNAGRPHAPRIRRADLPRRPQRAGRVADVTGPRYDVSADARSLVDGRLHSGGEHGTT
jgi:hypothetical protein